MKFSLWKTFSRSLSIALWSFLIFDLAILILIFCQENFDWNQLFAIFTCSICIFSLTSIVTGLPLWMQLIYFPSFLLFYYQYGYQILHSIPVGINYNFVWSLPKIISGNVIDFIFWSGYIFTSLIFVLQLQHWILGFLAGRGVGFASKIWEEEKTKLIEQKRRYLEAQTKIIPPSKKPSVKKGIFYLFLIFFLSGLIVLAAFLYQAWENKKYPILWKTTFPGTAICYWEKCGKKGALLPRKIEPGKLWTTNFLLNKENKELVLEIRMSIQPVIKPEVSLEIELDNPDKQRIFYISKEEVFKGTASDSPIKNSFISKRFNFIAGRKGEYTLKITSYNYGIAYIDILIRDLVK